MSHSGCQTFFCNASTGRAKPVLIGHNVASDVEYTRKAGFDANRHVSDFIDTANLDKALRRQISNRSLTRLLADYGVEILDAHNAGNDAYYTMWAVLAMSVSRHLHSRPDEEVLQERIGEAKRVAEAKARDEFEGCSAA